MDSVFQRWAEDSLIWLPEKGMGYLRVSEPDEAVYDAAYFQKYAEYADTDMGRAILASRLALIDRWAPHGRIVDVGIGCGALVETLQRQGRQAFGYDVNPVGVVWLKARKFWWDPYAGTIRTACLFDTLEHLRDPDKLLRNVLETVIVCLPIFSDARGVLSSKHFRRTEHRLYFTRDGLIGWMGEHGFTCMEHGTPESIIGRQDAHSFVFRRR